MEQLPLDEIRAACRNSRRYHFRMEYIPGLFYDGQVNHFEDRQHFLLGFTKTGIPVAEVFWEGREGFGRKLKSTFWRRLHGTSLPDLQQAVELLQPESINNVREEGGFWVAEIKPNPFPPRDDTENWVRRVFGEVPEGRGRASREEIVDLVRHLEVQVTVVISKRTYLIEQVEIHSQAKGVRSHYKLAFFYKEGDVPPLPPESREAEDAGFGVRSETLLLQLTTIGGWDFPTEHGPWAQRSLQLIADQERQLPVEQRKYEEIYTDFAKFEFPIIAPADRKLIPEIDPFLSDQPWHPIVLGVNYEDSTGQPAFPKQQPTRQLPVFYDTWFPNNAQFIKYFSKPPYFRSYHHYGGDGEGLEYHTWMKQADAPDTTCQNAASKDSYYSARDWGYGPPRVDENLNLLTFKRAIEQYHEYTWEGKRNAYLLLGHVVHLLQDQSEPDHSKLVAHGGSSFNEEDAYSTFKYCEIISANAAAAAAVACWGLFSLICAAAAYGIAYGACKALAHSNEVGYERLVMDYWRLDRVEKEIAKTGVLGHGVFGQPDYDYDSYFHVMSEFSKNAVEEVKLKYPDANLESALGCGSLTYTIGLTVPGLDPDIDVNDQEQTQPFIELTDKLAPQAIGLSAGLIQHFFDIVNYPPYVERVEIVQWEAGAVPLEFGKFADDQMHCVRYHAEWQPGTGGRALFYHKKTQQLTSDRPAYVFVLFGPATIPRSTPPIIMKGKTMDQVELTVKSKYPMGGQVVNIPVRMKPAHDNQVGMYYWGSFQPVNCGNDPQTVTLEITGRDHGPHYAGRPIAGNQLDNQPQSIARVDLNSPVFQWLDYTPGPDRNHEIAIAPLRWQLETSPLPLLIPLRTENTGEVRLEIRQRTLNCQAEPFWGPMVCPVKWELVVQVTKANPPRHLSAPPEEFGLKATFQVFRGVATLTVTILPHCEPGIYTFEVLYTLGLPPVQHKFEVPVKVLPGVLAP